MFTFTIVVVLCWISYILGKGYARHKENLAYREVLRQKIELLEQKEASIQEMLEIIDKQGATIKEYADMSPAEHIRVANNLLNVERKITQPCTYNEELRAARRFASKIMRQHLEPEV